MRRKSSFYLLAFALLPLLFVLPARERAEIIHQISLTCIKPFQVASQAASEAVLKTGDNLQQFWQTFHSQGELTLRVQTLERTLVDQAELQKENERLRKLLEFKKEIPKKTIPAQVIGRDLSPWRKSIVIDKGSNHGIKKKMTIVNAEGLVGRVVEVAPFSTRVILLLDPESRVSALAQESRDLGIVEGDGSPSLRMTRVDHEAKLKAGDKILSSGLGGVYSKGIPIGQVELVGSEKEGLEIFATVRPFVNFSKLEEVLCIASLPADS